GREGDRLAKGAAAPLEPRGAIAEPRAEFQHEARLAHPRLADEEHDLTLAATGLLERLQQLRHLALAADERREAALDLDVHARARRARGKDLPGGHRI